MSPNRTALLWGLARVVVLGGAAALGTGALDAPGVSEDPDPVADGPLATFANQAEYVQYVERGRRVTHQVATAGGNGNQVAMAGGNGNGGADGGDVAREEPAPSTTPAPQATAVASGEPNDERRVATTNVQEGGIDEPDLVKTDGRYFFYAPEGRLPHLDRPQDRETPTRPPEVDPDDWEDRFDRPDPRTHVVDTDEPADPELVERIDVSGRMLRSGDHLVVLASDALVGYDVSDPEAPSQIWERPLDASLVSARAQNGQLYLVTREGASPAEPCPLEPVGDSDPVPCSDVHHPREQIDADATYTAVSIDPASGDVADATSFVGTRDSTVVYMSENALYVTYTTRTDRMELVGDYLLNESERVPDHVKDRIREIRSYDLSPRAERIEIRSTVQSWLGSLDRVERRTVEQALEDGLQTYTQKRQRNLTETGIVKIGVGEGDLAVDAVAEVPGEPLNQFSLDEHEGTLRIATTIPAVGGADSENDLYVLDAEAMTIRGAATGMGATEEIYSVRYVEDTAYLVTFRRVDPFHVVDLSNPDDPVERGELKLPGFSDYLHPVGDGMIMGVGREDRQTKVVLFDATDPTDPRIADSKLLEERFSAVSETHHAFMQDARHEAVFLPAGDAGVVMSYANDSLEVEKRVTLDGAAQRARYVNDYLYVFAPGEITVLDETSWETETSLALPE
jgi:uncharacterized secreted protein with C-terminal beta-propeller domain